MSRSEWLSLYGRSFRLATTTAPDTTGCTHAHAHATKTDPRKDGSYSVLCECACGWAEQYEMRADR